MVGAQVEILTIIEVSFVVRFYCLTAEVHLDILHHTPKWGIPVKMVQFLLKLLLKHNSCCAP